MVYQLHNSPYHLYREREDYGVVLATDSCVIYGAIKRDQARKLEPLTRNVGRSAAGLIGVIEDVTNPLKDFCLETNPGFDDIVSTLNSTYKWYQENNSEGANDYACEGSGRTYGEYILRNHYAEGLGKQDAIELAVYTILETSKMDPNVREDIQMLVFQKDGSQISFKREDIEDIKAILAPLSKKVSEKQTRTVEEIVKIRDEINTLSKNIFGFELFIPNERAAFQITKPCRTEEEFTNNIAALALLIDQINIDELKKTITVERGSINYLEAFLLKNVKDLPAGIISNLRNIVALRSKRFPIHTTDPELLEVVVKLIGRYPHDCSDLWLKALEMYKESMNNLF